METTESSPKVTEHERSGKMNGGSSSTLVSGPSPLQHNAHDAVVAETSVGLVKSEGLPEEGRWCCDSCDEEFFDTVIRHKCQQCPDFDYCAKCIVDAEIVHPGHTFIRIGRQDIQGPSDAQDEKPAAPAVTSAPGRYDCTTCTPVTSAIGVVHLAFAQKKPGTQKPSVIAANWPFRLSRLIASTQRGCSFCAFIADRFFSTGNLWSFGYNPKRPWYSDPLAAGVDEERTRVVQRCMKTLEMLERDLLEFKVEMRCKTWAGDGDGFPDFDSLQIRGVNNGIHDQKTLNKIFAVIGEVVADVDVFVARGECASIPP